MTRHAMLGAQRSNIPHVFYILRFDRLLDRCLIPSFTMDAPLSGNRNQQVSVAHRLLGPFQLQLAILAHHCIL